jgi:hypothetical protein
MCASHVSARLVLVGAITAPHVQEDWCITVSNLSALQGAKTVSITTRVFVNPALRIVLFVQAPTPAQYANNHTSCTNQSLTPLNALHNAQSTRS